MSLQKLATIFSIKYAANLDVLENWLRKQIDTLRIYPHKRFNILDEISNAGLVNAKTPREMKAFHGYKFIKEVVGIIDDLKEHQNDTSMGALRESLLHLVNLIDRNKDMRFTETGRPSEEHGLDVPEGQIENQFSHVSSVISEMFPARKKFDEIIKNKSGGKAREGLSAILGLSLKMLEKIQELEEYDPERFTYLGGEEDIDQELPKRFKAQKTRLAPTDVVWFIRNHGDEYGIHNTDEWDLVVRNDRPFEENLSSTIYALRSGKTPRNAAEMKAEIKERLQNHREKQEQFAPLKEETELAVGEKDQALQEAAVGERVEALMERFENLIK